MIKDKYLMALPILAPALGSCGLLSKVPQNFRRNDTPSDEKFQIIFSINRIAMTLSILILVNSKLN